MRRGTTPVFRLTVTNYDVSRATDVWATFSQAASGAEVVRKWKRLPPEDEPNDGITVIGQQIICKLSQEDSLSFVKGKGIVQVKFLENDDNEETTRDNVAGTVQKKFNITDINNEDVM